MRSGGIFAGGGYSDVEQAGIQMDGKKYPAVKPSAIESYRSFAAGTIAYPAFGDLLNRERLLLGSNANSFVNGQFYARIMDRDNNEIVTDSKQRAYFTMPDQGGQNGAGRSTGALEGSRRSCAGG